MPTDATEATERLLRQSAALRTVLAIRVEHLALRTEELRATMTSQERPA